MPRAQFTVELPADHWSGGPSRCHPAEVNVVSVVRDDRFVFHLDVRGDGAADLVSALETRDAVREVEVLSRHDDGLRALAAVERAPVVAAVCESLTPIRFPLVVEDGTASLQVVTLQRQLPELGERLDAAGLAWDVDRIRQSAAAESLLTGRQRHILQRALELGYYDTPRTCTLTELAGDLGVAKSTCSETLHRAESAVMERFLGGERDDATVESPVDERPVRQPSRS